MLTMARVDPSGIKTIDVLDFPEDSVSDGNTVTAIIPHFSDHP